MSGGIIYELRCCINNEWHPFYVGRTEHQRQRLQGHRSSVANGTTLVYQFIREQLVPANIAWDLFPVDTYENDYVDQEDEHIMLLLVEGIILKNMKKGDANWMERRQLEAQDMRRRGMTSYRKYQQQLTLEEQERIAAERHARWLEEQNKPKSYARNVIDSIAQQRAPALAKKKLKLDEKKIKGYDWAVERAKWLAEQDRKWREENK
jgi:hypothetical protein